MVPPSATPTGHCDVVVIGGGVVGCGIAWEALRSGRSVALVDDAPGAGASWAAAGMLAPVSELHYQEEELLALMLEAARLWPGFAAALAAGADGHPDGGAGAGDTGYLTTPTLAVGADAADRRALEDLRIVQQASGLGVEPLTVRQARGREPLLSPGISCAFDIPADHQVDPRTLLTRIGELLAASSRYTGVRRRAAGLLWEDGHVAGIELEGGGEIRAGETIVANGLGAADLQGLPEGLRLPLRPVYGDILRLRVPQRLRPLLRSTVRGLVRGVPVYIVPRGDGTVVIGATQREDAPADPTAVSAGGVYQLLRDAQQLVPAVAELELLEATARARPGTPDNAPLLGRMAQSPGGPECGGLIIATGFFRHGVLLTPAAAVICRQLLDGTPDPRWAAFRPDRFSGQAIPAQAISAQAFSARGFSSAGAAGANISTTDREPA
ncbi:glycine oxidase ThiO [Arthrobacter sp. B3I4]|uniref:glycine oxidase ThiO n=1 Tax=Arthrobacter sp. B3I4 TaxID=3042267 RepID=UPI002784594D|nr:glycine oxidase ThiO [Arthrobacter sp. B3I4]MDQ0755670.1 glycine oxidase [Arthrobacter sp. B3I4]